MDEQQFYQIISLFEQTKDSNDHPMAICQLAVLKEDTLYEHVFNQTDNLCNIRSISKTIIALLLGILIEQSSTRSTPGIHLDTLIYPHIKHLVNLSNSQNSEYLNQVSIRHCLTHTIGHKKMLLMRDDIKDLDPNDFIDYICNYPILEKPGTHFQYTNAGFYLLSVFIQEVFHADTLDLLDRYLFAPLAIPTYQWDRFGKYCAGATNCYLDAHALIKFGKLILNQGRFNQQQIVPQAWIKQMITPQIAINKETNLNIFGMNYVGFGIWLNDEGLIGALGTDGQALLIEPESKTVLVTLAKQKDTHAFNQCLHKTIHQLTKTST